ncbi:RBBP8 N-terminal-like protein isoform X2 [Myripristis murdjan]|nr:RBBP8 N-terminal-like protein isoform X2 [Myripristis murdjan]
MESFSVLLHKLQEAHEREVEGWQVKVQELSNKKGCDTKRMEELFTRNQQMREQQRLLTENIKTLENRLRAGLCDRCTVTQEVAKRRQQEYEASQIQSLQHMSILAGEMNNLKKENKRLREEIRSLRGALEGQSEHSSNNNNNNPEVKAARSPDLSPSAGPLALVTTATSKAPNQPADGDVAMKPQPDQRSEESLSEHRQTRGWSRAHFPATVTTPTAASWKTEQSVARGSVVERRAQSVEGLDQRAPISPHLLLKNIPHSSSSSSSLASGEVNSSRHLLHAPVPCRPRPIKTTSVSIPWSLSETSDWVTLASSVGNTVVVQPNHKPNPPHFPNLIPTSQQANHCSSSAQVRRQVLGHPWPRHSPPQPLTKEQTVVLRVRGLLEQGESQPRAKEVKEVPTSPPKPEKAFGEGLKEVYEGPLDLSDRGRSKSSQASRDEPVHGGEIEEETSDRDTQANPSAHTPVCPFLSSSPSSPPVPSSSSSTAQPNKQQEQAFTDHNHKLSKDKQMEETNGETDQTNGRKVPVLTKSLQPVVVLETLNSALQKQESLSSNGKSSPTAEPGSSSEEQDGEESLSGQDSSQGSKRKRPSVDTDTDRDSDADEIQQERKIKITLRHEDSSN